MNIEIEIKNVYPAERNDQKQFVQGGLHVSIKLGDIELNIRGILFSKEKERFFFRMPFKSGISHKTKLSVQYPIISFSNAEFDKTVIDAIYEKAPKVIEGFLAANPQTAEPMKQQEQKKAPSFTSKAFVTPPPLSKKSRYSR